MFIVLQTDKSFEKDGPRSEDRHEREKKETCMSLHELEEKETLCASIDEYLDSQSPMKRL